MVFVYPFIRSFSALEYHGAEAEGRPAAAGGRADSFGANASTIDEEDEKGEAYTSK